MKIRLQGTEKENREMVEWLKERLGPMRIKDVSKPYKDRNGETERIYIELNW